MPRNLLPCCTGKLPERQLLWGAGLLAPVTRLAWMLIELPQADGVRIIGNLLGDPEQAVRIGAEVVARFEHHTDAEEPFTLLHWQTA